MFDAVCYYRKFAKIPKIIRENEEFFKEGFVLATVHRAENTDIHKKLIIILNSLQEISFDIPVIFPVHPRTMQIMKNLKLGIKPDSLFLVDPVSYFENLALLDRCSLVMTDSGGLQKEAYFFKKPCLTLRDETEWIELLDAGVNQLVPIDQEVIISHFKKTIGGRINFPDNLYGNGAASVNIVNNLREQIT